MSVESLLHRTCRPPEPPCTPGISPTPSSTTYHPYTQNLSALTEYLRQKLCLQCAKCLSRSHPTQVEQNVPLERNTCNRTKEGAPEVINCKVIPTTMEEDEVLKKFIKEQLEKGYIRKFKLPYTLAFFFIKKKDRKLQPIQDYWRLNQYTIKNKYLLPLIPDLISQVRDTNIFSKFDICWGCNNMRIKEGDQHKAAFKTKYRLYKPNIMLFGLTNSPAMFQARMDHLLQQWVDKWALEDVKGSWYMDNILMASRNKEKHQQATHKLLDILEANDLFLKPGKCVWEQPHVNYLGLILEEGVTCMDPAKIVGIANWPTPTMVKQVRSFLGFCSFYWPFIYQFSHIAKPLNELTRKDTPWSWKERQQEAFETLRKRITTELVLKQPNWTSSSK